MIRETATPKNVINLDGPDGNVFSLMATAYRLGKDLRIHIDSFGDPTDLGEDIIEEMKYGDYVNAVKTFDKYFGEYVILETENEELLNA